MRGLRTTALLLALLASDTAGSEIHYERRGRVRYIKSALSALQAADRTTLKNTRRYIHVIDRNRCRSSFTDLRTSCLLEAGYTQEQVEALGAQGVLG